MDSEARLRCRVAPEVYARVEALAARRGCDVPTLLRQLVGAALEAAEQEGEREGRAGLWVGSASDARSERLTVRLRPGDGALLRDRAEARGLKPATYLAHLVRAHLRQSPVMPGAELVELKRTAAAIAELARTMRTVANQMDWESFDLIVLQATVESARASVAAVVRANLESWESSDG